MICSQPNDYLRHQRWPRDCQISPSSSRVYFVKLKLLLFSARNVFSINDLGNIDSEVLGRVHRSNSVENTALWNLNEDWMMLSFTEVQPDKLKIRELLSSESQPVSGEETYCFIFPRSAPIDRRQKSVVKKPILILSSIATSIFFLSRVKNNVIMYCEGEYIFLVTTF